MARILHTTQYICVLHKTTIRPRGRSRAVPRRRRRPVRHDATTPRRAVDPGRTGGLRVGRASPRPRRPAAPQGSFYGMSAWRVAIGRLRRNSVSAQHFTAAYGVSGCCGARTLSCQVIAFVIDFSGVKPLSQLRLRQMARMSSFFLVIPRHTGGDTYSYLYMYNYYNYFILVHEALLSPPPSDR